LNVNNLAFGKPGIKPNLQGALTCRVNQVEPYAYLNYLFEHLPAVQHRRAGRGATALEPQGDAGSADQRAESTAIRRLTRRLAYSESQKKNQHGVNRAPMGD